ncbi:polcalcin Jun o 2 [Fopius arisanus]|uniref:Polcalcin Jun o 2 n=1 Tax=Fopius arisanus TaxID=64838 RepID=A0A9R1TSM4_9HYME|nr:PREDICTED: polcalcin Jun o 2 [Fopius arisanus]XP_011297593.1 PREDICTED: polcalcin Jun o 2 [Fopius arisanus]XP_011297594.1 PREDICTED: polcalcin Jun o 2 [Fopius arisanus]XP_011297595.1 PREDICTED: polcalcin Jun o 2 [Fopius arisanus]XP_011297596.1 PREDICTED: polcalcin Jun o 2 [Fopius arisanus]XP_011297597.1 PREDICTED: polcalcin Jun o 2 [Fopius arisanus]
MTRKDTEGVGDEEESVGGSSSRPSVSDVTWPDIRKPPVPNEGNKLTGTRQGLPTGNQRRQSDIASDMAEVNKQLCARRRGDECSFGETIRVTCETSCDSSITGGNSSISGPSATSAGGQTRLTTSLLFELPDARRGSTSCSDDRMPSISKAQMKEFEEAFNLFDKDRDGSITKEELGRVMRGLGQFARTEELRTMLEEIDTDGDGNVSLVEFVKIVSNIGNASAAQQTDLSQEEQEEQELRDAFRVFDKHNRGYITASDLRAVLQCLGEDLSEEEIEDMIKEVDEDGDGRIDFYEFARSLVDPGEDEDEDEDEEETPQSPPF